MKIDKRYNVSIRIVAGPQSDLTKQYLREEIESIIRKIMNGYSFCGLTDLQIEEE